MSIILKGIDIPKEGEWLEVIIKPTKEVIVDTVRYRDNALLKTEYGSAIQIPKDHGRLIDGDKLDKLVHEWSPAYTYGRIAFTRAIENAPTILEVEETNER